MKTKWNSGFYINNSNKHMSYKVVYSYTDNGERIAIDEYFYQTDLIDHWVPVPIYRVLQNDPDHVRSIFAELHKLLKPDLKAAA